jgi:hypothetical protein
MDGEFLLKHLKSKIAGDEGLTDAEWLNKLGEEPLPFPVETIVLS